MRLRIIAALEFALIFPAALFMGALVFRTLGSLGYEPAHRAQQLVMWYAGRMWTLWVLLLALPFAALLIGCATLYRDAELLHSGRQALSVLRRRWATLLVAVTTVAAVGILAIVILHMLAN
jgi:ABC-type Fe3+ transport system permease subunit